MNAKRRVTHLKSLIKDIGLEPERVQMYHVSSAQAAQFAQAATEMSTQITSLGPSPLRKSDIVDESQAAPDDQNESSQPRE